MQTKFLGISGSIRANASSSLLLQQIGGQLPGVFTLFNGLADIPAFDGSEVLPLPVQLFVDAIAAADYVVICSPEYAHGVPGALKNALDWTVATNVWTDKPVAVLTAASQGDHAHASLLEILNTMSARVGQDACLLIPFIRSKINAEGFITDEATSIEVRRVVRAMQMFDKPGK